MQLGSYKNTCYLLSLTEGIGPVVVADTALKVGLCGELELETGALDEVGVAEVVACVGLSVKLQAGNVWTRALGADVYRLTVLQMDAEGGEIGCAKGILATGRADGIETESREDVPRRGLAIVRWASARKRVKKMLRRLHEIGYMRRFLHNY